MLIGDAHKSFDVEVFYPETALRQFSTGFPCQETQQREKVLKSIRREDICMPYGQKASGFPLCENYYYCHHCKVIYSILLLMFHECRREGVRLDRPGEAGLGQEAAERQLSPLRPAPAADAIVQLRDSRHAAAWIDMGPPMAAAKNPQSPAFQGGDAAV